MNFLHPLQNSTTHELNRVQMAEANAFDPVWEQKYNRGHAERYPWDVVVSFIFRNYPSHKSRDQVKILEIGCGTGNNLWFAAREGFQVTGIDGSSSAITFAEQRFREEGLQGNFCVGDFTELPFNNDSFDLVFDRGSLTCCGISSAQKTVNDVKRVLHKDGKFLCNPYSDRHSSYVSGRQGADEVTVGITAGTLVGVGQICFYGRRDVEKLFAQGWKLLSFQHLELCEQVQPNYIVHSEWRVIAQKLAE